MSKKKKKKGTPRKRVKIRREKRSRPGRVKAMAGGLPNLALGPRAPFSEIRPPKGFRQVTLSQAMMEYARPVFDYVEDGTIEDPNVALEVAGVLWNYSISMERVSPEDRQLKKLRNEAIGAIRGVLGMTRKEAEEFFDAMMDRKFHLFPPEVQPARGMVMFMRKDTRHLVPEFDYSKLSFPADAIPPDDADRELIEAIRHMDELTWGQGYPEGWEQEYFELEEAFKLRFTGWLRAKGLEQYSDDFPFCVSAYINFVYRYTHDRPLRLKDVATSDLEDFLCDFVLRKYVVEPHEYVQWPPAIRLLYIFLCEKGYVDDSDPFMRIVNTVEPRFIKVLRGMF